MVVPVAGLELHTTFYGPRILSPVRICHFATPATSNVYKHLIRFLKIALDLCATICAGITERKPTQCKATPVRLARAAPQRARYQYSWAYGCPQKSPGRAQAADSRLCGFRGHRYYAQLTVENPINGLKKGETSAVGGTSATGIPWRPSPRLYAEIGNRR